MKKRLAEHYFECGVVKTALNIFQELQLFDNVVNCLEIIGKKDEAVQLVFSLSLFFSFTARTPNPGERRNALSALPHR